MLPAPVNIGHENVAKGGHTDNVVLNPRFTEFLDPLLPKGVKHELLPAHRRRNEKVTTPKIYQKNIGQSEIDQ